MARKNINTQTNNKKFKKPCSDMTLTRREQFIPQPL